VEITRIVERLAQLRIDYIKVKKVSGREEAGWGDAATNPTGHCKWGRTEKSGKGALNNFKLKYITDKMQLKVTRKAQT